MKVFTECPIENKIHPVFVLIRRDIQTDAIRVCYFYTYYMYIQVGNK